MFNIFEKKKNVCIYECISIVTSYDFSSFLAQLIIDRWH